MAGEMTGAKSEGRNIKANFKLFCPFKGGGTVAICDVDELVEAMFLSTKVLTQCRPNFLIPFFIMETYHIHDSGGK